MEPTLEQIEAGMASLETLLGERLPVKAAWAVSRLHDACAAELRACFLKRDQLCSAAGCTQKEKMLAPHPGAKPEPAMVWHHKDAKVLEKCMAEWRELMTAKSKINALPLELSLFGDVALPGHAFKGLEWAMKAQDDGNASG